ncbi:hypothetical protein [Streptomyces sp. NPDC059072]|uniref:hypothetical protein n=1 Tax=unclassified Streptomyces TaxID=2593676 RepID=UPI0036C703F7
MDERIFRVERFRNGFNCRTPSGTCYPAEYENKLQSMKTITIPVPSLDDGDAVLKQIVVNLAKTNEQGTGNTLGTGTLNVTPGHNTYTFPGDGQASVTITRTTR